MSTCGWIGKPWNPFPDNNLGTFFVYVEAGVGCGGAGATGSVSSLRSEFSSSSSIPDAIDNRSLHYLTSKIYRRPETGSFRGDIALEDMLSIGQHEKHASLAAANTSQNGTLLFLVQIAPIRSAQL